MIACKGEKAGWEMLIGELARLTQCSVRVIRHYEQSGLLTASRSDNGYRHFDGSAVEHVTRIRVLLRNGFTVDDIRPVARMHDPRSRTLICADVIGLYEAKVDDIDKRIADLMEVRDRARQRLAEVIEQRRRGGPPEPDAASGSDSG